MGSLLRRRPSPAMAVALTALFLALGGVSYGLAIGSIGSREIKNNSVRSVDIRDNDVRSRDIRNGSLLATDFKAGQLPAGPRGATGPQGPAGEAGPSNAFSVTVNDSRALPESPPATIGRLDLQPAAYVILARVVISGPTTPATTFGASCELQADDNKDTAVVRSGTPVAGTASIPVTLTLVHKFASAGSAVVACYDTVAEPASFSGLKITAIRVANAFAIVSTP